MDKQVRQEFNTRSGTRTVPALKALFLVLFLYMTWVVIDTSLRSNLLSSGTFLPAFRG